MTEPELESEPVTKIEADVEQDLSADEQRYAFDLPKFVRVLRHIEREQQKIDHSHIDDIGVFSGGYREDARAEAAREHAIDSLYDASKWGNEILDVYIDARIQEVVQPLLARIEALETHQQAVKAR